MDSNEVKKLYRSLDDKWVAGVCGGIAEYLGIDSIIIRIVLILLVLMTGIGLVFYIIAWIMIPLNPNQVKSKTQSDRSKVIGAVLLILGSFLLLKNLEVFPLFEIFEYREFLSWGTVFSILLILIGIILIIYQTKKPFLTAKSETIVIPELNEATEFKPGKKILRKSRKHRKIFGVCAGIGEYLDIDVTIIRLIFVLLTLSSLGLGLFLYIILAIIMPDENI